MAKGQRRSTEERIVEIDAKIAGYQETIKKLEAQKVEILTPKKRRSKAEKMKAIMDEAKKTMSLDEIAEKLGVAFE